PALEKDLTVYLSGLTAADECKYSRPGKDYRFFVLPDDKNTSQVLESNPRQVTAMSDASVSGQVVIPAGQKQVVIAVAALRSQLLPDEEPLPALLKIAQADKYEIDTNGG